MRPYDLSMVFDAQVINLLIASPSDTLAARDEVEHAVLGWNRDRARVAGIVVLPLRWETDSVPLLGASAQEVINKQLLERADVVVGLFHSRLGQPTATHPSGTAEEILKASDAGKPTHVYFADLPHPANVDVDQLHALRTFRSEIEQRGLLGSFASSEDLASKIRAAIEHDLGELALAPTPRQQSPRSLVQLRGGYESQREQYLDSRGRIKYKTRAERIVVTNDGASVARGVKINLTSESSEPLPRVDGIDTPKDIASRGSVSFPMFAMMGTAIDCTIHFSWQDGDGEGSSSHSISLR